MTMLFATSPQGDPREPDGSRAVAAVAERIDRLMNEALADQIAANRRHALRAARIVDTLDLALAHPHVYTHEVGADGDDFAERAVYVELSLRLQLSETHLRTLDRVARSARTHLPHLWRRALDGFAAFPLVEATVIALARIHPSPDATPEEREHALAAIREIDDRAGEWALLCSPAAFRARLARLIDRLDRRRLEVRHAQAMRDRRVVVEDVGDGMSWVSALVSTVDAFAIKRRLTATAKHLQKDRADRRTRDQVRADLFSGWLRGVGTPTAVKTKVFVTIPITLLAGEDSAATSATGVRSVGSPEQAQIVGAGTVDPITAEQLFLDAPSFRRLIVDPVHGVPLDLDRRTYRPTKAQRDWLVLRRGTCARDGCTRLAIDADLDHDRPFARGGATSVPNLRPLCPSDHAHRHRTTLTFRTRPDGSVAVGSPTGFASIEPPPF